MQITPEAGCGISDENSVAPPLPVNRKRKRMSKRGSNADKWTDEETLCFILVLHDDAVKHGCDGSTVNGPHWRDVIQEFWTRTDKKDQFSELRIKSKYQRLRQETKAFQDLLNSCSGYGWDNDTNTVTSSSAIWTAHLAQRTDGGKGIAKFRYQGLKHWKYLEDIFGKSFATGNHVVYSTNPVSPQRSNEATAMEQEATDWDDYLASTENVYRPMSVNTSTGSGKRTIGDMSMGTDIGTSTRRKKKPSVAPVGSHNYLEDHLRWKREKDNPI